MSFRIGVIISSFRPVIGGAEKVTEASAKELAKVGIDVLIFTRRYSSDDVRKEKKDGVTVFRLGYAHRGKLGALTFALHTLLFLIKDANRLSIVHIHNSDTPALVGIIAKLLLHSKVVATIHGEAPILARRQTVLGRLRMRLVASLFDACTSMNPANEEALRAIGVPSSRIYTIPNGVDQTVFHPPTYDEKINARMKLNFEEDQRIAVYVGRLVSVKSLDVLLEAWAQLEHRSGWQLVIVGSGPEERVLKALARELMLDVRFEGASDDVYQYLCAADLFILPSGIPEINSYEGMSIALLEAMASGLPVIASDCPGNAVLIQHGVSGLMFEAGDSASLANQIQKVIADSELQVLLGRNAYAKVKGHYTIDNTALKIKGLYEKICLIT